MAVFLNFVSTVLVAWSLGIVSMVRAGTVTLDWNITWLEANPDGAFARPVIGINGQWPLPLVNVTKGDRIVAHVHNLLGNQSTGMHFHGMFQNGTNSMDGAVGATQCSIPPGSSYTYNFTVNQPGTYWYHSHIRGQYTDGVRGQFLVHDPQNPYGSRYAAEIPLSVSDWYHAQMPDLIAGFVSVTNPSGAEPVPDAALMNDTQNLRVDVQPNTTYLFRMVNVGAFAGQYFWIEGHNMTVVEVDGVYTEPLETNMIYLTVAQRYSFLVTTRNDSSTNFAIVSSMDTDLFDKLPDGLNYNVTGWLVYDTEKPLPTPAEIDEFSPLDDFTLVAQDGMALLNTVDQSIELGMAMDNLGDGANYAFFNDITYVTPKVPTLYTVKSSGPLANDTAIYGSNTHAIMLERGQVIEIILNNNDPGKHPFHLHGHNFQVVYMGADDEGPYDPNNNATMPAVPMRRDVMMVRPNASFVIRFVADNPGVWLFHCHIEWHLITGLAATLIEAPFDLQQQQEIPQDHLQVCRDGGSPYTGNAAGNTADLYDLAGANISPAPLPSGFTTRGIIALVFSIISAFAGMAVITWYGIAPLNNLDIAGTD